MHEKPTPDWDPRDPAVLADQRAAYDEMRERCPVAASDLLGWSVLRHADVMRVIDDLATFSNASRHPAVPNGMDPPEHTRYRTALEPFFDPEPMAAFEPRCRQIAREHAERLVAQGEAEFVSAFAEPFALQAACAFLGWPPITWISLREWNHGSQDVALSGDRERGAEIAREIAEFVIGQVRERRERGAPADEDVTTRLMATEVDGHTLTDEEIVGSLRNWTAGHGTLAGAIGIVAMHLAQDLDLQRRLREDPSLVAAAVEEIPRADGPLVANRRTATQDVEIEGRQIRRGDKLSLNWIAANRDPRVFDDPDAVRLDRDQSGNLLYGAGIHVCMGAPLARLELRVAIEELLARTTAIEPGPTPPRRDAYPSNGLAELSLRFR